MTSRKPSRTTTATSSSPPRSSRRSAARSQNKSTLASRPHANNPITTADDYGPSKTSSSSSSTSTTATPYPMRSYKPSSNASRKSKHRPTPGSSPRPSNPKTPSQPSTRPWPSSTTATPTRSEEHTSELQSRQYLVCRLLL